MALDEPGDVVAVDEAGHGLAEFLHGVVQLDAQALVLGVRIQRSTTPLVWGSPRNAASSLIPNHPIDRLQAANRSSTLATWMGPGLDAVVVHQAERPHLAVAGGPGHGGVGAQRWLGGAGMIVPLCGRRRRWPAPAGSASSPFRLSRRSTRFPFTWTWSSRRSRPRTSR